MLVHANRAVDNFLVATALEYRYVYSSECPPVSTERETMHLSLVTLSPCHPCTRYREP
jgi:hypothetical protein